MRILFCNIGWMEDYKGLQSGASIKGGGAYVEKEGRGHEVCNFCDHGALVYGYVQTPGKNLDIERIAGHDADFVGGVLIVWTAPVGGQAPAVVVGWYKDATVFRTLSEIRQRAAGARGKTGWTAIDSGRSAKTRCCFQSTPGTHEIPKHKKGLMGQSNIWYADTTEGQPVVESVLALVNGTSRPPATRRGKTDPGAQCERGESGG